MTNKQAENQQLSGNKKEIVDKVAAILANTDSVIKMHIGIFGDAGEVPVIRYSIEESIGLYDCEECGDCVLEKEYRRCEREKRGEFEA